MPHIDKRRLIKLVLTFTYYLNFLDRPSAYNLGVTLVYHWVANVI